MRLLCFETPGEGGVHFVVKLQTAEDVWHLYNMVEVGDDIRCSTTRKITKETASGAVAEKRHMTLNIHSTAITYDNAGGFLRVSGLNRTVSEWVPQNSQHTLQIGYDPPADVGITKAHWDSVHQERLTEACDESNTAEVAAVLCGAGHANFFLVNGSMTSLRARLRMSIAKKKKASGTARDESLARYYGGLLDLIVSNTNLNVVKALLLGAPQHLRDEFMAYFSARAQRDDCPPPVRALWQARSRIVPVLVTNTMSMREVMADPLVQERLQLSAQADEVRLWSEFNQLLNTMPDRVTYGMQIVFVAHVHHSAIESLMVSDEAVRGASTQQRHLLTELIDSVRELGGNSVIFSSRNSVGEQLHAMGGVAAVLRVPLPGIEDRVVMDPNFLVSPDVAAFLASRAGSKRGMRAASSRSD
jgi:protein pelota